MVLTGDSSDALSRHLRRCTVAQRDSETVEKFRSIGLKRQTRDKRACDHCAHLKLRCTFQLPCDQCRRQSLVCTYTRNGYIDPYESFRIDKEESGDPSHPAAGPAQETVAAPAAAMADRSSLAYSENETACFSNEQDSNDWLSMDFSPADFDIATNLTWPFAAVLDTNLSSLSWDWTEDADALVTQNWAPGSGPGMDALLEVASPADPGPVHELGVAANVPSPPPVGGFTLRQLDPVEAKCSEIRDLLHGTEPLISRDDIRNYITRDNVLMCGQAFGQHLSRNVPIVHSPSFMLTEAPRMLLLAVTLGGACYFKDAIPARCITKFTMGLLISIERQTVRSHALPYRGRADLAPARDRHATSQPFYRAS